MQPPLGKHLWPAFGKEKVPGDILFWPRDDQKVLGIPIKFTHWAVYVGRRRLASCHTRWMLNTCEETGDELPESVVHLWGAADSLHVAVIVFTGAHVPEPRRRRLDDDDDARSVVVEPFR